MIRAMLLSAALGAAVVVLVMCSGCTSMAIHEAARHAARACYGTAEYRVVSELTSSAVFVRCTER